MGDWIRIISCRIGCCFHSESCCSFLDVWRVSWSIMGRNTYRGLSVILSRIRWIVNWLSSSCIRCCWSSLLWCLRRCLSGLSNRLRWLYGRLNRGWLRGCWLWRYLSRRRSSIWSRIGVSLSWLCRTWLCWCWRTSNCSCICYLAWLSICRGLCCSWWSRSVLNASMLNLNIFFIIILIHDDFRLWFRFYFNFLFFRWLWILLFCFILFHFFGLFSFWRLDFFNRFLIFCWFRISNKSLQYCLICRSFTLWWFSSH